MRAHQNTTLYIYMYICIYIYIYILLLSATTRLNLIIFFYYLSFYRSNAISRHSLHNVDKRGYYTTPKCVCCGRLCEGTWLPPDYIQLGIYRPLSGGGEAGLSNNPTSIPLEGRSTTSYMQLLSPMHLQAQTQRKRP